MATMTISTGLPSGRAFTVADLDRMPEDGNRYELIDGALIVTPSRSTGHQRLSMRLSVLLFNACPAELELLAAPLDVRLADDTKVQPDLVVVRRSDLTDANLPVAPLLAVEILSPATRSIDLHVKRERLRRAGCASYWVVDPADGHLIAWDLDEKGDYAEVADIRAGQRWTAQRPFPVTIVPGELLD